MAIWLRDQVRTPAAPGFKGHRQHLSNPIDNIRCNWKPIDDTTRNKDNQTRTTVNNKPLVDNIQSTAEEKFNTDKRPNNGGHFFYLSVAFFADLEQLPSHSTSRLQSRRVRWMGVSDEPQIPSQPNQISDFESTLELLWNCSEIALKPLFNFSQIALKLLWNCSEIALKILGNCSPVSCSETALKLFRNCSEIAWKMIWNCSKTALKLL